MIKLGVIGLGTIFPIQYKALNALKEKYHIVAACDHDSSKIEKYREILLGKSENSVRIYSEAEKLFEDKEVEAVLIATPPHTHFSLARMGLRNGKSVLLEKPATTNMDELLLLYREAEENGCILHIAYHAAFAKDLEWFLEKKEEITGSEIVSIECGFFDPYMNDGIVMEGKRSLGGCYIDSGVNALSVCSRLLSLEPFGFVEKKEWLEDNQYKTVYEACHVFASKDVKITLLTGWNKGLNQKRTYISFADNPEQILLDHSNQRVIRICEGQEQVLYVCDKQERLETHYGGVFKDFEKALSNHTNNKEQSLEIHRLLLNA